MITPVWVFYSLIALVFFGITGVTQKLSTNSISTQLAFLWFATAFVPIVGVILIFRPLDWGMTPKVFALAVVGGAVNGLGAYTSFAALERGGKASIVVPLVYLYPLLTILLARAFLHETISRAQGIGVVLAILAAILLSRETPAKTSTPQS